MSGQAHSLPKPALVVVASENPVKLQAVSAGFAQAMPHRSFELRGISVPSQVPAQPLSDELTRQGALNRASAARAMIPEADFWVGVEGGIAELCPEEARLFSFAWVLVLSRGRMGQSRSANFELPAKVADLVRSGLELGDADDIVFGLNNSKQNMGSVGILTHNALDRAQLYAQAVLLALIPFVNTELFPTN